MENNEENFIGLINNLCPGCSSCSCLFLLLDVFFAALAHVLEIHLTCIQGVFVGMTTSWIGCVEVV